MSSLHKIKLVPIETVKFVESSPLFPSLSSIWASIGKRHMGQNKLFSLIFFLHCVIVGVVNIKVSHIGLFPVRMNQWFNYIYLSRKKTIYLVSDKNNFIISKNKKNWSIAMWDHQWVLYSWIGADGQKRILWTVESEIDQSNTQQVVKWQATRPIVPLSQSYKSGSAPLHHWWKIPKTNENQQL